MGMQGVDSEKAYQNWTLEVENEISTPLFKTCKTTFYNDQPHYNIKQVTSRCNDFEFHS